MSRTSPLARVALAAVALSLSFTAVAQTQDEQGWNWTVAPYVWLIGVSGDTSLPDRPPGDEVDVSAGDVLDSLEFAALARVGATSEHWRFLADGAYLGLGKRSEADTADIDIDSLFIEFAGAYRPNEHVDLLFGVRYWDMGFEIDLDNPLRTDVDVDADWVDPIIGVRLHAPMGESWDFLARVDVGGFGVGSDFTWNAEMMALWNATERFSLALGYRHLAIDETIERRIEDVDIDLAFSGPEIGFVFRF